MRAVVAFPVFAQPQNCTVYKLIRETVYPVVRDREHCISAPVDDASIRFPFLEALPTGL